MVYTWYIPCIYMIYTWYIPSLMYEVYAWNIHWIYQVYQNRYTMNIPKMFNVYPRYIIIKKVRNKPMRSWQGIYLTYRSGRHTHVIYHVYTMYIPLIYLHGSDKPVIFNAYSMYILYILYSVNAMCIPCISMIYSMYIHGIYYVYI